MSISAADHLAQYGVSVDEAYAFIIANLATPEVIYNVAITFGVTSAMLGEITGYSAEVVEGFFTSLGMDGEALREETGPGEGEAFVPAGMEGLTEFWAINMGTGDLSNEAMRAQVITSLGGGDAGLAKYNAIFDPERFAGGADGTFSAADLGFDHLGDIPADQEHLEALFFGTVINLFRRVDESEDIAINGATAQTRAALVIDAYEDPIASGPQRIPDASMPTVAGYIAWQFDTDKIPALFDGLIGYWGIYS